MKIKWGVIGCGGIAFGKTIPGMLLSKNSELVAVMDQNPEMLKKCTESFDVKYAFETVEELLALEELDAVYIATPVFCHKEQVAMVAKAGKHILLEKPMGLTVKEAEEIDAICRECGVKLGVGFMMRFSAYHQKIKELIAGGAIGQLFSMRGQFSCWYPDKPGVWRQNKALSGGGALIDMGVHCIDLLQYVSGTKATSVACFAENAVFDYNVDSFSALLLKMENGAVAMVDTAFCAPKGVSRSRLEFYGTKGSIIAERTVRAAEEGTVYLTVCDPTDKTKVPTTEQVKVEGVGDLYEKEISSFANAILNDTDPEISAADGILAQRIVENAYLAAEQGVYKEL